MKNITVLSVADAFDRISECKGKYSVLYIVKNKKFLETLYHEEERFGHLDLHTEHRKLRNLLKSDKSCIEVIAEQLKDDDYFIEHWQVDEIIRFCQRQFDIDNVFIIHEDHYNAATNLADQLALCYDIDFEYDFSVDTFEPLRKKIITKYNLITHSPLYTLSPLDYCKEMCRLAYKQAKQIIKGQREDNYGFFNNRQCTIYLKSGLEVHMDIEMCLCDMYLHDMDEIEYVDFAGVPEIAEPSAFEEKNYYYIPEFGIYDFYDDQHSLKSQSGTQFRFDSINGITRNKSSYKNTPEKNKNYKTIERGHWEFYNNKAKTWIHPKKINAYAGIVKAETFLEKNNSYKPKYYKLPMNSSDYFYSFYVPEYKSELNDFIRFLKNNDLWKDGNLETLCAYAAGYYTAFLGQSGHCENMTILRTFFEYDNRKNEDINKFEKLWNIDKYVPSLDTDPLNQLCLAVYALIQTVKPYNEQHLPDTAFNDCLENIYRLTEGKSELNDAVILTGVFAGVYCCEPYNE